MKKKESSKIRKSGFNPNRACSLTADGKYYCYEFEDIETGQTVTQKLEVGKDLSQEWTIFLDETDHHMDLNNRYQDELRDHLFDIKTASYKADPNNEDAVDPWDTIADKTSYGKSSNNIVNKQKGWKVGDPIDNLTKAGYEPSWSTVKSRYWKNEAHYNPDMYSRKNLELMKKGKAPRHNTIDVPKELHHINGRNIDNPHNIDNLMSVWPWEHAEIDPYRYYTGPRP